MTLQVIRGPVAAGPFELQDGENIAGRAPDCAVCLPSKRVSRQHCVFTVAEGRVYVRDLASHNGVLDGASGRRVGTLVLAPGGKVQVGDFLLSLEVEMTDALLEDDDGTSDDDVFIATSEIDDAPDEEPSGEELSLDDTANALRALGALPAIRQTVGRERTSPGPAWGPRPPRRGREATAPRIEARPDFKPRPLEDQATPRPGPAALEEPTPRSQTIPMEVWLRARPPAPEDAPTAPPETRPRPRPRVEPEPPRPVQQAPRPAFVARKAPATGPRRAPAPSPTGVPWLLQAAVYVVFLLGLCALASGGLFLSQQYVASEAATRHGADLGRILAARNVAPLVASPVELDLSIVAGEPGVRDARVTDARGVVLAPANKARMDMSPYGAFAEAMRTGDVAVDESRAGTTLEVVVPIRGDAAGGVLGYAWVEFDPDAVASEIANPWLWAFVLLVVLGCTAVVLVAGGWWLGVRPMAELARSAEQLASGRLDVVGAPTRLEAAEAATRAMNELAARARPEGAHG